MFGGNYQALWALWLSSGANLHISKKNTSAVKTLSAHLGGNVCASEPQDPNP
jgi:hypothetical protein